jgi:hypothetical protein
MYCLSPNGPSVTRTAQPTASRTAATIPACSRVVNVNIHFILRQDGTGNWNETDNGIEYKRYNDPVTVHPPDTAQNGYAYARGLVDDMNWNFSNNPPQGSPQGIANPAKKIRVTLNGVYFHRVSPALYEVNKDPDANGNIPYTGIFLNGLPDPRLFDTYGVAKDTVINMIVTGDYTQVHVSDISGIARGIGYDSRNSYYATANWFKVFNANEFWRWRQENQGNSNTTQAPGYTIPQNARELTANTMCHELGHLLGLYHTFEQSASFGCQDITYTQGASGNNLMDYVNAGNIAVSPCQLDIMHGQLDNPASPGSDYHLYLTRSACDEVPPRAFFTLTASTFTDATQVWMDGRGTYAADGWQLNLYRLVPGFGMVRMGTYTKHGGLGQRLNLATVFNFSNNGEYRLDMKAVKPSGQFHVYQQSFIINAPVSPGPACNDCEPPHYPPTSDSATGPVAPVRKAGSTTVRP